MRKHTAARWLSRHPYTVTSLVFFGAILCGWFLLGWGERQLAFVLLLYFIVALGVRLDEIFRAIGGPSGNPSAASDVYKIQLALGRRLRNRPLAAARNPRPPPPHRRKTLGTSIQISLEAPPRPEKAGALLPGGSRAVL